MSTACMHRRVEYFPDEWTDHWRCTDCGIEFGPIAERTTIAEPDTEQLAYKRSASVLYRHGRGRGQP